MTKHLKNVAMNTNSKGSFSYDFHSAFTLNYKTINIFFPSVDKEPKNIEKFSIFQDFRGGRQSLDMIFLFAHHMSGILDYDGAVLYSLQLIWVLINKKYYFTN